IAGFQMPGYSTAPTQIGMGSSGVELAQYQIQPSTVESVNVTNVYLQSTSTYASAFYNYRVMVGSQQYDSTYVSLNGTTSPYTAEITGVNLPVPQNGSPITVAVYADASSWSTMQQAGYTSTSTISTTTVAITKMDYTGVASNQTNSATSSAAGNAFASLRTTLTPAAATAAYGGGNLGYGGFTSRTLVGAFNLSAGSSNQVQMNSMDLTLSLGNMTTPATTTTSTVITVNDPKLNIDLGTTTIAINGITTSTVTLSSSSVVPAGVSEEYYVYANLAGYSKTNAQAASTAQMSLYNWNWQDGTRVNIGPNPNITLPVPGNSITVN
ncbi:MAG: hypothetical protein M1334_02175, partial [Patescibacteria group bacterium]|nr:hypothetical protein [Patescibacteria group bacterium]